MSLSERSQSERYTFCVILIMWLSKKDKSVETIKGSVLAKG